MAHRQPLKGSLQRTMRRSENCLLSCIRELNVTWMHMLCRKNDFETYAAHAWKLRVVRSQVAGRLDFTQGQYRARRQTDCSTMTIRLTHLRALPWTIKSTFGVGDYAATESRSQAYKFSRALNPHCTVDGNSNTHSLYERATRGQGLRSELQICRDLIPQSLFASLLGLRRETPQCRGLALHLSVLIELGLIDSGKAMKLFATYSILESFVFYSSF